MSIQNGCLFVATAIAVRREHVLIEVELPNTTLLRCVNCDTLNSVLEMYQRAPSLQPGTCKTCHRKNFHIEDRPVLQIKP